MFGKKKELSLDDIKAAVGALESDEREQLRALLSEPQAEAKTPEAETKQEQENETPAEEKEIPKVAESEAKETASEPDDTTETASPAPPEQQKEEDAETIEALSSRITAQDAEMAALQQKLDTIIAKLEDRDFGAQAQPPVSGSNDTDDTAIMRRYNPKYRG